MLWLPQRPGTLARLAFASLRVSPLNGLLPQPTASLHGLQPLGGGPYSVTAFGVSATRMTIRFDGTLANTGNQVISGARLVLSLENPETRWGVLPVGDEAVVAQPLAAIWPGSSVSLSLQAIANETDIPGRFRARVRVELDQQVLGELVSDLFGVITTPPINVTIFSPRAGQYVRMGEWHLWDGDAVTATGVNVKHWLRVGVDEFPAYFGSARCVTRQNEPPWPELLPAHYRWEVGGSNCRLAFQAIHPVTRGLAGEAYVTYNVYC